ncbi:exopolysaccharide biosynthesis protein [Secundilactobacillus paracollinoides]|uniref:CpsD/CapB family tyrosine-protein kinase n=1 Tax=Secundilactobacillus paracollinoides TaxID=240427 RepID=UPI00081A338F|nr:CpsD/CapB family tyrosine-protein kinase [Secundilactobacillus paracollinoides]ANZ63155.1 exopolysaccharide biosynthesis protein [Secundilactobacillus paracollinoides]
MALFRRKRKLSEDTMQIGVKLVTAIEPKNVVSEQFRTVRTNIDFSSVDKQLKTLLFTSSGVSEGKSTVSANTAVAWAQQGKKVLFIDADLRRPTLHSTFGLLNSQGLSTILANDTNFHDVAVETAIENLTVITSGPVPPNPAELLNSNRMKSLLKSVESEYDLVLLDVPPLLSVTDTQVLSANVDGVILVVRQGVTQSTAITRAVELLKMVHANVLGYVLNDMAPKNGYGYGYGYGYK